MGRVRRNLTPMGRTRKCSGCGAEVVKSRTICPHCSAPREEEPRWVDPSENADAREGRVRAANNRMRYGSTLLFLLGILLMSQGFTAEGNFTSIGGVGVFFIVIGTIAFLFAFKLAQKRR